jgi:hypothetical protein
MYFRRALLSFFCFCLVAKVAAQQGMVNGVVHKKSSPDRVAQVLVTNTNSKATRLSDDLGRFQIPAKTGDTLLFKKNDYATQLVVINLAFDINVFLQPNILLNEVSIKEQSKKQEVKEMMNLYKSQGSYYTLSPSIWSLINSPLTGFYELFGQGPNRARRFQAYTQEELQHIEIYKRYNVPLIKKVTGETNDKEIEAFRLAFTPAYEDIKAWTDYELISYIKRSYDYYKENKHQPKLPKLY